MDQCCYILIGIVGVGSFISHAFLNDSLNFLNELPLFFTFEMYVKCICLSFSPRHTLFVVNDTVLELGKLKFSSVDTLLVTTSCISLLFYFGGYKSLYTLIYSIFIFIVILLSIIACVQGNMIVRELYLRFALSCFVGCLFWWLEELLCEETGYIWFHAMWHLLLSYSLYVWVIFALAFRGHQRGKFIQITFRKTIVPTITYL